MGSNGRYLSPRLLQGVGVVLLILSGFYWAVTGHQSALFVSAAMGLIGLGSYAGINISVKQEIKEHQEEAEKARQQTSVPDIGSGEPLRKTFPGQSQPMYEDGDEDDGGKA